MPQHRLTLTFSAAVYRAIIARWGSEKAWKDWAKTSTLAECAPQPDVYTSSFEK